MPLPADAAVAYSRYCEYRDRGLRKQAQAALRDFLDLTVAWPFSERLPFVRRMLSEAGTSPYGLKPQPMRVRLIEPTLREWSAASPEDAEPHLWLGLLHNDAEHVERALALNSECDIARRTLVRWIIGGVAYNRHEMPAFYIHDPRDDLKGLRRAQQLCDAALKTKLAALTAVAQDWLTLHPREGDFAEH